MADMSVDRVPGEHTTPELSAKRPQRKPNTNFANLLKGTAATAGHSDRMLHHRAVTDGEPVSADHVYLRDVAECLGRVSASSAVPSASQTATVILEKLEGESNEDWQRRCIAFETSRRWQVSSREWKAESASMDFVEGIIYCSKKATQWVTDLMENEPAMFREWLEQEKWHIEESGLDNALLPAGFTEEDMSRWMAKGVLEYL